MVNSVPLSIITVTHNHHQYVERYMSALLPESQTLGAEVIIVDNCSD
ncbi:MAG: hypothetical protein RLZZ568_613, partial [Cyanobacteriota bacterium]